MVSKSNPRRWILLIVVALGVVTAATLPWSGSDESEPEPDQTEAREAARGEAAPPKEQLDGGMASRRIAEGCDPIGESLKYEEFIGRRAHAILSWNDMPERAANLKIPVHVKSVEDGAVGVSILEIPMREQYLNIWMSSGHIERGPGDSFLLDPCSARIEAWGAMDRLTAPDEAE